MHYNKTMSLNKAPIFQSFEKYKSTLPAREIYPENSYLAELPYFVRPQDLDATTRKLEEECDSMVRGSVKYLVSPSGTGKSTCIGPAFLNSAQRPEEHYLKFSHYLYLAFDKNRGNYFDVYDENLISKCGAYAQDQGLIFMKDCIKYLLEKGYEGNKRIHITPEEELRSKDLAVETVVDECQSLLNDGIGEGRILFHIDEQFKIAEKHPKFRYGAMELLSKLGYRCTAVSTYVNLPFEIEAVGLPGTIIRFPVPIPVFDVNAALKYVNVSINEEDYDDDIEKKRSLASLKFRLAIYIFRRFEDFHNTYSLLLPDYHNNNQKEIKKALDSFQERIKDDFSNESMDEFINTATQTGSKFYVETSGS